MKSFIRLNERSTVLLPHPDGPMIAVILFLRIFRLMFLTALKLP